MHCGGLISYVHPRVNHNAHLNYSCESILFMTAFFPCHLKVRRGWFSGRNRAVKAALSDGGAFIFHTGLWSLGTRSSGSADEPYYLYITSICWELEPFSYVKHLRHYLGKFTKLNILVDPLHTVVMGTNYSHWNSSRKILSKYEANGIFISTLYNCPTLLKGFEYLWFFCN